MRVDSNGSFTGQWLFDAAIITSVDFDGTDLMYGGFSGSRLDGLLDREFADASSLDLAAAFLAANYGAPRTPIQVVIGVPWIANSGSVTLPGSGTALDLSQPVLRRRVLGWYLREIGARARAAGWRNLTLYGAYYHREEIIDVHDDPAFAASFNADAHDLGMKTVWVPYFGAPHAWDAATYGFDVSNVQPGVAFRSAQYGGEADCGRLYAVGEASVTRHQQSFEYESSTGGECASESWASHQYLAVAQETGASAFPQVFFAGLAGDMFDTITTRAAAVGERWRCYDDLADYLAGKRIANVEIGLPRPVREMPDGTREVTWSPPSALPLWSVRLDFEDADEDNPWRGRIDVRVDGPGGVRSSFGQRVGQSDFQPYESLTVPLALSPDGCNTVDSLTITLSREAGSTWPNIARLVAQQHTVPLVASGISGEPSWTTYAVQDGPYSDSARTHLGFAPGKLTDGLASPTGNWQWNGVVGWNFYDGRFTVTIDLGRPSRIGAVDVVTHYDPAAGVNWPYALGALVGRSAPARHTGIAPMIDAAVGSSGRPTLTSRPVPAAPTQLAGTVSLPIDNVLGRYVTVIGNVQGWGLLDQIVVKESSGTVISTGKPYTITPKPSVQQGRQTAYGDNSWRLVDNSVTPNFFPQFSQMVDGIPSSTGGTVTVEWAGERPVRQADIWVTNASQQHGVVVPPISGAQWRDQNGLWRDAGSITISMDGVSPHATMRLPSDARVTGLRATLDPSPGTNGWYMVSQVTAR